MSSKDHQESTSISQATTSMETTLVVPVIEESLVVDKRVVVQGGYRIVKSVDVCEEVVDESLVAHTVDVERRIIGRLLPSIEIPASRQEGNIWIVSVVEEALVTEKRLILKEELHIRRTESTTHHLQKFSLRRENVAVEPLEPGVPSVNEKL